MVNAEVVRCKPRLLAFLGPAWTTAIVDNNDNQTSQVPDPTYSHFLGLRYRTLTFLMATKLFAIDS